MVSRESDSSNTDPAARRDASGADGTSSDNLLQKVLQQSLEMARDEDALDASQMTAMLEVIRTGGESDLSPAVVGQLVLTVLQTRFGALGIGNDVLQEMAERIAAMLLDDPIAGDRMVGLWARLTEAADHDIT